MFDILQVGNRIRELRISRGLTQQEFAKELCVSFQAVSAWERGIAPPELENLIRIASFFGVMTDDLLRKKSGELILGVDGGGTKTAFAVVTPEGYVVDYFTRGGCNPNDIGLEKSLGVIYGGISQAVMKFPAISSVFCGIAGSATADNAKKMTEYLSEKFPSVKLSVRTDSANLLAMDDEADMAIISGTGSVVYVRSGDKYERLGGWGYLLDDAGSGYDIGREAVRVALSEEDGKKADSLITKLLKERLEVKRIWDSVRRLYEGGRPFIASLAGVVFEAYRLGDANAKEIIDKNAARLAELLNLGIRLYGARPRAVTGGGIFEHYPEIMNNHISKYTVVELVLSKLPPIYGACRIAAKELGDVNEIFYENFKKSYGDITQ